MFLSKSFNLILIQSYAIRSISTKFSTKFLIENYINKNFQSASKITPVLAHITNKYYSSYSHNYNEDDDNNITMRL